MESREPERPALGWDTRDRLMVVAILVAIGVVVWLVVLIGSQPPQNIFSNISFSGP